MKDYHERMARSEHKVTIQEIADMAGVSKSTVSRYLNQGYISEEKAARIRDVIHETGYKANFFAKRLKMKESKLVGVVLPRIDSVTVGKLLTGIGRVLEPRGYQGLLLSSQLSPEKELASIRSLAQQGVDGIIVDSIGITDRHVALAKALDVPVVFTGQQHPNVTWLKLDDYAAGRLMGAYLQQMGHTHAVFLGVNERDKAVGGERKRGFLDAFLAGREEDAGVRIDFVETGFDFLSAYNHGSMVEEKKDAGATVVVCATDNIALGVLRYFHERRIRVPEEISVTGFGGYDVSAVVYPALTTIQFDYDLVGMKTAQLLLHALGSEDAPAPELPLHLIERESVKKIGSDEALSRESFHSLA